MGCATVDVDVGSVWFVVEEPGIETELREHVPGSGAHRPVGAVDDQTQVAVDARPGMTEVLDVRFECHRAVTADGLDERLVRSHEPFVNALDVGFFRVVQFRSTRPEELEAVVGVGVVRGGDHRRSDAAVLGQKRNSRRRRHADEVDDDALGAKPFGNRTRELGA